MVRLTVTGGASAQLLLRAVNLLAQRGLVPRAVTARTAHDAMTIVIDLDGPHDTALEILVEKLRAMVEADAVTVRRWR